MCWSCLTIALQQQQHRQLCAFLHGLKHFVQKRYSPILQFCQILLFYHNLGINPIWLYSIQSKFPKHLGIQGKIRLSLCSKGTHSLVVKSLTYEELLFDYWPFIAHTTFQNLKFSYHADTRAQEKSHWILLLYLPFLSAHLPS